MKTLSKSAIITGLMQAKINQTPVKLVINGNPEPYFGEILEVTENSVSLAHFDHDATTALSDITNIIS